ncbi:DUF6850 family outer membrane beta-barrel protein [Arthrospiribacter ruber]|uniref:DUF6850 domain-containing protein n=1 Tax=Arthrospiribacter ruber TaxID=2487934 RepID=A0A951IVS8_9BACT|nr:DUF6850 family outer membrane beta-barrel protein [Arthrospiribacter ruber]MBW3466819.1 hypothetical protein [Arthrospiribacter ruber]MBW3469611.1 hypothetical protein [Arthrospiribacter ruber]MBW3470314.1 hypothetical protein [Arthrospiribacter ruber]
MKMISSIHVFVVFGMCFLPGSLMAKGADSLLRQDEQAKKFHPVQYFLRQDIFWHAAYPFLMDQEKAEFYRASLNYSSGEGNLVASLMPESFRNIHFYSQSGKQLGNWSFQGDFQYTRELEQVRPFLMQSMETSLHPYLLAQEQTSPWSGDKVRISLSGNSARYLQEKLGNFFRVNYQVETFAMDAEPRPLYNKNRYEVQVGQSIRPHRSTELGAAATFSRSNEENQIGAFAVQEFSLIFMRGLNTFSRNAFQSFTRNQFIEESAFQLYGRHTFANKTSVFLQFSNGILSANLRDGIAFPVDAGSSRAGKFSMESGLFIPLEQGDYQQHFSWEILNGTSMDPVFEAVNFLYRTQRIEGVHTFNVYRSNSIWELRWASIKQRDEDFAAESLRSFSSLYLLASNSFALIDRKHFSIFLRPGLGVFMPQPGIFPELSDGISQMMHGPDRQFYQSNHLEAKLSSWFLLRSPKESVKLGFDYTLKSQNIQQFSIFQLNLSLII